jgi:hypothetical protein
MSGTDCLALVLSGAPICAGNEPVFPRYWVEKALNLAMKDLTV